MDTPDTVVRTFFDRMQERDWDAAARCLSDRLRIRFTETGEQFDGPNFLAMNQAYPEGWHLECTETISQGERVAVQVRVEHRGEVYWCAGFYTVHDGVIVEGVEHWVTEQSEPPPDWRARFAT